MKLFFFFFFWCGSLFLSFFCPMDRTAPDSMDCARPTVVYTLPPAAIYIGIYSIVEDEKQVYIKSCVLLLLLPLVLAI